MARFEQRMWEGNFAGLTRRDRRPCRYSVYLPDLLSERSFIFDGDVAADLADAEAELVRLNTRVEALSDTEALARLLLRAESVASSRIEGLVVGGRRLLRADIARQMGAEVPDVTAREVLANIDAMVWGVETVDPGALISLEILLEVHRRLLAGTYLEDARRPHSYVAKLDRGQQLQSLFRSFRATAARSDGGSAGRPGNLLQ